MGNTMGFERNPNNSHKIKLGTFSSIHVSKITSSTNEFGEAIEMRSVTYQVYARTSNLTLTIPGPGNRNPKFIISISDSVGVNWYSARIEVKIVEGGHVAVTCASANLGASSSLVTSWNNTNVVDLRQNLIRRTAPDGGITESSIFYYEGDNFLSDARSLMVLQLKKRGRGQSPYEVTVAHYFVHLGLPNTGLSMVANIHGQQGFMLLGPIQHPGIALDQVLQQAKLNAYWDPNACPHCAIHNYESEDEEEEDEEEEEEEDSCGCNTYITNHFVKYVTAEHNGDGYHYHK